jgi:hypothetical protein
MNYKQMLEKFVALEEALWELSERIAKLEREKEKVPETGFKELMEQGS